MNIGELIEFGSSDDPRIGAVIAEVGKQKLEVITSEGDQMRPQRDQVSFETGIKVADLSATSAQAAARRFAQKVDEAAGEIDIAMLWEFVRDDDTPQPPTALTELYFGEVDSAHTLATLRVLRTDGVFFRQKRLKGDPTPVFEPRPADQVEEMQRQQQIELEKAREREVFVLTVADLLDESDLETRAALAAQKMADPNFRRLAHIVQAHAIDDGEDDPHTQANELLDAVEAHRGKKLRQSKGLRAFYLMVDLGIWAEHENLHLLRRNIPTTIADDILEAAHLISQKSWEPEAWRRDLTRARTFSIDDITTRDIDDALSVEFLPDGRTRVGVHIADPSARVSAGSLLDRDARARGTSIYLPTGNFPMFAPLLSHDQMSLVQGALRPAISTIFEFSADLELLHQEVVPSMVQVDHRLTYRQVDALLGAPGADPTAGDLAANTALTDALQHLTRCARNLLKTRQEKGAINIDLPELHLHVDFHSDEIVVSCEVHDATSPARQMVSEWMVANNRVIGEFCRDHNLPTIYRGQVAPDGELFTEEVLSVPEGLAREFALVRKLKPGDVSTEPAPHFGLGLAVYVQGSSPIRRYSDLVCQRQLKAFLAEEALPYNASDILEVLATVETTARDAKITERETARYWTLYHLANLRGQPLNATVVEHKEHNSAMAGVFLHDVALKANCKFAQRPPVGAPCQVTVATADPRKDTLHLRSV